MIFTTYKNDRIVFMIDQQKEKAEGKLQQIL